MKVDSRVVTKIACVPMMLSRRWNKKLHHCLQCNVASLNNKPLHWAERITAQLSLHSIQQNSLSSLLDRWCIIKLHFHRVLVTITLQQILAFSSNVAQFLRKHVIHWKANPCISLMIPSFNVQIMANHILPSPLKIRSCSLPSMVISVKSSMANWYTWYTYNSFFFLWLITFSDSVNFERPHDLKVELMVKQWALATSQFEKHLHH